MSSKGKKKKEVLVVVHDAGGAEVIGAYLKKNRSRAAYRAYGAGPAIGVFKRLGLPLSKIRDNSHVIEALMERHKNAAFALLGKPGWMSRIEIHALQAAKRAGLKSVVYADSWTDDRKKFGYPRKGWEANLPDAFWAGDRYAFAYLKKRFPRTTVKLVPNQYFAREVARYRARTRRRAAGAVLFASTIGPDSMRLLRALLNTLASRARRAPLRIRFHPADDRARYDALVRSFKGRVRVQKSREKDIVRDLARARTIVGAETMALSVARLCGLRTISFVRGDQHPILPQPGILRVRDPSELSRLI